MICALYTLMRKYRDKKIYVWNINRTSMVLFTKIAFMRIDIHGFVTMQEEYAGEMYMNRPVVTLEQFEQEDNSIIIVADEVPKDRVGMIPDDKVIYWSDALGINEELRHRKILVYGTGKGADRICEILFEEGLEAELYCVSKKNNAWYKGKKVIEASELEYYGDYSVIISVKVERYRKEILDTLSRFSCDIFVEHIIDEVAFLHLNLFQYLDLAIKRHRKIYLYGIKNQITELVEGMLSLYDIKISGYVYDVEDKDQNIENIFAVGFEGIDDKLIIINEILQERLVKARAAIELAGFSLENGNYAGLQWYTASSASLLTNLQPAYDPLVGASIFYSHGKPGWKLYGKEEEGRVRILILGGSTSSEVYHPENWVSKLYYKLKRQNVKITIYNGAHTADDIVDEMLRLLRDGHVLQPQIVISMSGVNNLQYKNSVNLFNESRLLSWVDALSPDKEYASGVCSDESVYSFWSRNQKLLKLVSNFYGAVFFGFLQPINITMKHMSLWEKSVYEIENSIIGAKEFAQSASDENEYINLMRLFDHQNEMFIDMAHYTDKAHEIIADKVYEAIIPLVQRLRGDMQVERDCRCT